MQQNINAVSDYMTTKSAETSTTNQYDNLLSQLTSGATNTSTNNSTSSTLLDQLNANSALAQFQLNR